MRGVYAIADVTLCDRLGLEVEAVAAAFAAGGAAAVQLRAKDVDGARFASLARAVGSHPLFRAGRVHLFINDRVDVALVAGAPGVHVGQTDLAPDDVKMLAKRAGTALAVGLSTHDEGELQRALELDTLDYVAIGPVFGTTSKERPSPTLGIERARSLAATARRARPELPIVAIGGIDEEGARLLAGSVDAVAVISALVAGVESQASLEGVIAARIDAIARALEVRP
ncbi:MAG: thiamine phosphate synthase [Polyangiaceae bacterium]